MTTTKSAEANPVSQEDVAMERKYDLSPVERQAKEIAERRPYKFTADVQRKILVALQMGHFAENAAAYGGVSKSTFMNWVQRGIESGPDSEGLDLELYNFAQLCTEARAASKIGLVAIAWRHAREDGKVAIALMEKLFPEEYGRKTTVGGKVEHTHKKEEANKPDYSKLSDEELEQMERLAKKARRDQLKDDIIDAEILE